MAAAEEKKENKADLMEYRMLGGTGLKVSCLGFGPHFLSHLYRAPRLTCTTTLTQEP